MLTVVILKEGSDIAIVVLRSVATQSFGWRCTMDHKHLPGLGSVTRRVLERDDECP